MSSPWLAHHEQWIGFHVLLLLLLAAELVYASRRPRPPTLAAITTRRRGDAVVFATAWLLAALGFAGWIVHGYGGSASTQFLASYALEQTLSIDNLFLFLLLFRVFHVDPAHQPRVLFWGVAGAIVMRGLFIAGGLTLLARFEWVSYVFAIILLIAAVRLLFPGKPQSPDAPPGWIAWISRIHPVSERSDRFFTVESGRRTVTMLFLALFAIELTDVVFALDSIPAVLSITRDPFLAYTSNILAVMSLRSLFFLLAEMLRRLSLLHYGLAALLSFAAAKMLLAPWISIGPLASLAVIAVVIALTIGASLLRPNPSALH